MNEGEIKVAEKTQFNGNLALLRVCAIVLIVNVFNIIIKMLLVAERGGVLASLWSALTTSSFEDIIAAIGLLFVSGWVGPIGLAGCSIIIALGLGIFALVKKNVTALKIVAVIMLIWTFVGPFSFGLKSELRNLPGVLASLIFNVNLIVAVAVFFIASKKRVEENNDVVVHDAFNLGLYRFCAAIFLVRGLNGVAWVLFGHAFSIPLALLNFAVVVACIFALAKKNTTVLMACSLVMVAQAFQAFWSMFQFIGGVKAGSSGLVFFMMVDMIVSYFFTTLIVVCVATFFIEPELTRTYFNKVKSLFVKSK